MDIEELNRTQIVLLVILVSFVTSIATGIVTVALLAQAPPAVTQTVNHVIQRTIETVVPTEGGRTETIKETTIVVKEEDLVTQTIAASFSKVGSVHETGSSSPVVALGFLIGSGIFVTDSSVADGEHLMKIDGDEILVTTSLRFEKIGILLLTAAHDAPSFRIADTSSTKLGSTVIAIPSTTQTRVGIGALASRFSLATIGDVTVRALDTTITGRVIVGAPLLNAFGDVIGISTSVSQKEGASTFVSMSDIAPLILGVRGVATSTSP